MWTLNRHHWPLPRISGKFRLYKETSLLLLVFGILKQTLHLFNKPLTLLLLLARAGQLFKTKLNSGLNIGLKREVLNYYWSRKRVYCCCGWSYKSVSLKTNNSAVQNGSNCRKLWIFLSVIAVRITKFYSFYMSLKWLCYRIRVRMLQYR